MQYNTYFYETDRWNLDNYKDPVVRNGTALLQVNEENATLWIDFLKQEREKLLNDKEIPSFYKNKNKNKSSKCFIQSDDDVLLSQVNMGVYIVYLLVQIGTNVPMGELVVGSVDEIGTPYNHK